MVKVLNTCAEKGRHSNLQRAPSERVGIVKFPDARHSKVMLGGIISQVFHALLPSETQHSTRPLATVTKLYNPVRTRALQRGCRRVPLSPANGARPRGVLATGPLSKGLSLRVFLKSRCEPIFPLPSAFPVPNVARS